ncbi:hypothetical protein Calab_1481 [Caldithrix abyssi DSM 13497]|uniref:DUF3102 domain-containing protein n=1 Tax=Caldithrix abyssi DSM 13497 TaxID=880073 RepID=H1XPX6_CALAY|nr:hypothetical protein [Caldithrix abyssi]APF20369.1 hypothetical protein Cabys_3623 [Caldithrix abyssi DSM 13497]EHO41102.1 hypothetical protein Calab_1481 [Caldithrix abyssi DSM 13497]
MNEKQALDLVKKVDEAKEELRVYDEEGDKVVKVSKKMQDKAWELHMRAQAHLFEAAKCLYQIKEEKLYLALGFSSFRAYYESVGMKKRTVFKELNLGQKLLNAEKVPTSAPSVHQNEGGDGVQEVPTSALEGLGKSKLIELARLSQEQFNAILSGEEIEVNGERLSLAEARKLSAKELAKRITRVQRDKEEVKTGVLRARVKQLEATLKLREEELKATEARLKRIEELEKKYEKVENDRRRKLELIGLAREYFKDFVKMIGKAEIKADDVFEVREEFFHLFSKVKTFWEKNEAQWAAVLTEFLEE